MISVLGLVLFQLLGSILRRWATGCDWRLAMKAPSSAWVALLGCYLTALGPIGLAGAACLLLAARRTSTPTPLPSFPWKWLAFVALISLARPWIPLMWDEFVWLGKARLEVEGWGHSVAAAMSPELHLIPAGYPPLWPAAVGWLTLGHDSVDAHVVAAGLLTLWSFGAAIEPILHWNWTRPFRAGWALLCVCPLVFIHWRSAYVDLPVGFLGLAVWGWMNMKDRVPWIAGVLAMVLVSIKDEGLAHLAAIAAATLWCFGISQWRRAWPLGCGLVVFSVWRWLVHHHGVTVVDHALDWPDWQWAIHYVRLLALHATDVYSWGLFWVASTVVLLSFESDGATRSLRATLLLLVLLTGLGLIAGSERVRVFAENGSLLNRVLIQWWPYAAAALFRWLTPTARVNQFPSSFSAI